VFRWLEWVVLFKQKCVGLCCVVVRLVTQFKYRVLFVCGVLGCWVGCVVGC